MKIVHPERDVLLDSDEVNAVNMMLEVYIDVYFKHACKKAGAFRKHEKISAERHDHLVEYFTMLRSEILLADIYTVRDRERKIDHADTYAWMAVKYLPDAATFDFLFPFKC